MVLLYAITLLLSATLLFWIEPMFAKIVLPLLGGTPAVWNTCMLFYQAMLLAGYVYAHVSTAWLGVRRQALFHLGLLVLPLLTLPIGLWYTSPPPTATTPIPWLLTSLVLSIGLPLFVISTTAPLLQHWFANTGHPAAKDPYFLYAASNLGSLIALLGYPILVEPRWRLVEQSWGWSAGYCLLALLIAACAFALLRGRENAYPRWVTDGELNPSPAPAASDERSRVTLSQRLGWIALSFVPSSLLLGVTTYLTTDIASVPLLWVIPLALYLLTFVLVFLRRPLVSQHTWVRAHAFVILPLVVLFLLGRSGVVWMLLPLHLLVFFVTGMVCHGELARRRPAAEHLTEFYLWMSFGGVLGGVFNSIVAPLVFSTVTEYPLALVLGCLLRPMLVQTGPVVASRWLDAVLPLTLAGLLLGVDQGLSRSSWSLDLSGLIVLSSLAGVACYSFRDRPIRFGLGVGAILVGGAFHSDAHNRILLTERSFFGVLRVFGDSDGKYHHLVHGYTIHGAQCLDPERRRDPLTYYHRQGPIGQVFTAFSGEAAKSHVAAVGLGTGTLACYGEAGQHWTFYEIDPAVERLARDPQYFTYLSDCPAQVEVVLGDARLSLTQAPDRQFGIIVLDAFSSDAIPMHLLTREALQGYLSKLADGGLLAFHISSRHLRLHPVLANLAADAQLESLAQEMPVSEAESKDFKSSSNWFVMARHAGDFGKLADDPRWKPVSPEPGMPVWTDDFSNILSVARFQRSK